MTAMNDKSSQNSRDTFQKARDLSFLGAFLGFIGSFMDITTTFYALHHVQGAREMHPLNCQIEVAQMISRPETATLWGIIHVSMPFLLFFLAELLVRKLKTKEAVYLYLAPIIYAILTWAAVINNLFIIIH
jgi:hypothetical protein